MYLAGKTVLHFSRAKHQPCRFNRCPLEASRELVGCSQRRNIATHSDCEVRFHQIHARRARSALIPRVTVGG